MENIRPEDRPKLFALLGAVVVVFAFVFWTIMKSMSPSAPAPEQKTVVAEPVATTAPEPAEELIDVPTFFAAATMNPFQKVLAPERPEAPAAPTARAERPTSLPMPTIGGRVDPYRVSGPDQGEMELPGVPGTTIEVKEEPPMTLQGIVTGDNAIAVVDLEGQSHILQVGDVLPNGYMLKKIDETGATLGRDKTQQKLSLGQSKSAA